MKEKIANWIKKQVKEAGARGIVMGLSGGVDSSVVACLSKEAVGKGKVLGLLLPCHSHKEDLEDAKLLARKIGIKTETIDLTKAYNNLIKILPQAGSLARANLKPRLRMLVLYYFANNLNYMVVGTGNKSECSIGYFTKHGDGATDILPIGDLLKREVRKLARELKVPERIIAKAPSAGLWMGQTDESEMGITYFELDGILERLELRKKQISPLAKVNKVRELMRRSEHKRQGPRLCHI